MENNELEPIVPRNVLAKQGVSAVAYLAGGAFLMVMTIGSRLGFLGIVLSLAALVIGIGALVSKDREDKKAGIILTAAGILGLIIRFGIPILKPFAGFILGVGAIGLLAAGLWKGIKFLLGLRRMGK